VRRNAVLAINGLFKLPKGELLLPDAPELIEKVPTPTLTPTLTLTPSPTCCCMKEGLPCRMPGASSCPP
jgi:hypothetical protein